MEVGLQNYRKYERKAVILSRDQYSDDDLLTVCEAASFLTVQPKTLRNWRCNGIGPKVQKIGTRSIRYRVRDLREFEKASNSIGRY
jgi:hypothetical protein